MMTSQKILSLGVAAVLLLFTGLAAADRIAYVDARRLVEESPQGLAAAKQLEDEFIERNRALRDKLEKFDAAAAEFEKNRLLMKEDEVEEKVREFRARQNDLQREQFEYNEAYGKRREENLQALEQTISETVVEIARSEQYDLVVQQAVFAGKRIDITAKVLQALTDRFEAKAKK